MAAVKKSDRSISETEVPHTEAHQGAPLEDVSERRGVDGPESPARQMQTELQNSISAQSRRDRRADLGRVLATCSGITTLLGVFIFSGIW